MTKTPEEKQVVQQSLTTEVVKENLTSEEKAREYAGEEPHESRTGFIDSIIWNVKYSSFIEGYHSRDTEVQQLKEVVRELVEYAPVLIDPCVAKTYTEALEIRRRYILASDKAKQLLKKQ